MADILNYKDRCDAAREYAKVLDDKRLAALLKLGQNGTLGELQAGADLTSLLNGAFHETNARESARVRQEALQAARDAYDNAAQIAGARWAEYRDLAALKEQANV